MIRRLRSMFAQPGFAVLLAVAGMAVFGWPFPELARSGGNLPLFVYFFGAWGLAILLCFLLSRAAADPAPEDGDDA